MKLRWLLLGAGVLGIALLLFTLKGDLVLVFKMLKSVRLEYLLLLPLLQFLSFYANAKYYQSLLASFGKKVSTGRLYGLSFALTFTTIAFPSAGVSGVSFLTFALKKDKVPAGKVAFVQFARYALTYISFIFLLLFGLSTLYFGGEIASIAIRIIVLITTVTVFGAVLLLYMLYDQRAFNGLVRWLQNSIDWLSARFRHGKKLIGRERIERVLTEFHDGFGKLMQRREYLRMPFWWALLGNVFEVATFYSMFLAVGLVVNPGVVIIAYALANAAGFLSLIPGDFGIYEVAMIAALSFAGVPVAIAFSVTLLYRVLTKSVVIPVGFYFYNRYIKELTSAGA